MIRQLILAFCLIILIAFNAKAATNIQCDGQASDRAVINIDDSDSTLFMTSGIGEPDEIRVLKNLRLYGETPTTLEFLTDDEEIQVTVPRSVLGTTLNSFEVVLTFIESDYEYSMRCNSHIFNN